MREELDHGDLPVTAAAMTVRSTRDGRWGAARDRGFTLIELMIVVAIVAILAAVAYPAYTSSVLKGKRGQGRAALLSLMQQQERYMTQTGSYMMFGAGATGNAGTTASGGGQPVVFQTWSGDSGSTGAAYQLGATTCPGLSATIYNECVILFAVPSFADPGVGVLTVQSTGQKSCYTDSSLATQQPDTSACWP
jgi:type IV pilus assembly protein PilE